TLAEPPASAVSAAAAGRLSMSPGYRVSGLDNCGLAPISACGVVPFAFAMLSMLSPRAISYCFGGSGGGGGAGWVYPIAVMAMVRRPIIPGNGTRLVKARRVLNPVRP